MPKYIASFLILILCSGVFAQVNKERLPEIVEGEASMMLSSAHDSNECTISYAHYRESWPKYKETMNGMIHRFVQVNTAFDYDTSRHDALSPSFYRSQLDSMQALFDEELEFNEESSAWSLDMQIAIDDEKERFATLILSSYAYTGGAHGNWGTSFIHIDRKSGKELSLEDFFVDINQLNDIAEPFFRKEYDLSPEEDLEQAGYWFEDAVFSVNNNFAFEGKDLVFLYGLYEIAPYASGTLELRIPLKEVEHLVLIPVH